MRTFARSGDLLIDVYGLSESGNRHSFQMPIEAASGLRWTNSAGLDEPPARPSPEELALSRRRLVVSLPQGDLSHADLVTAARLGDPEVTSILDRRVTELALRSNPEESLTLIHASGVLLGLDPTNTPAAEVLVRFIDQSNSLETRCAVAELSHAYRHGLDTEAMGKAYDLFSDWLRSDGARPWGLHAYTAISCLLAISPDRAVQLCETELQTRAERSRHMLVNELAVTSRVEVVRLLHRQLSHDTSPRIRLLIGGVLGDLVAQPVWKRLLAEVLRDEAPSWRYRAIKSLRRLTPAAAHRLAATALRKDPDPFLRRLLEEAILLTRAAAS